MNRKGVFGFVITLVLLVLLVWVWAILQPNLDPVITTTLNDTSSAEFSGGINFFVRAIPWMVPVILIIGMMFVGSNR